MNKNYKKIPDTGFTLIELLVVIAIMSLLFSLILASLNTAREKGRDSKRISELKQIQLALELYYSDYGHYPAENSALYSNQSINANGKIGEGSGLDTLLSEYLPSIPLDPLGPGSNYYYYYDGRQYCGGYGYIAVIFARNMESTQGNADDFCTSWGGEGGAGQTDAWHIIIGESSG